MSTTTTEPRSQSVDGDRGRQREGSILAGSTEARPGIITTEFWLTLAAAAAVVIVSYLDDALDVEHGWTLGIALIAAYVISRGIAKAGSSERFIGFRDGSCPARHRSPSAARLSRRAASRELTRRGSGIPHPECSMGECAG
jgi:hypothetical protein